MTTTSSAAVAPAGWYPDPAAPAAALRWWDGWRWTDWQAVGGQVVERPLPPPPAVPVQHTDWTGLVDERARWPRRAVGFALGAMVLSFIASGIAAFVVSLATDVFAVQIAAGMAAQTSGLYLACRSAQRRWGSDQGFRVDFGLRYGKGDWWRGLLTSIAARIAGGLATFVVVMFLLDRIETESSEVAQTQGFDWPALITFCVVAALVAPVIEELFFRGLLQRALESMVPTWVAIAVQGVVFGLLHGDPSIGMLNVVIIVPIGVAGMGFGFVLHRYKRLGPCITAHAWFNLLAVAVMLAYGPS